MVAPTNYIGLYNSVVILNANILIHIRYSIKTPYQRKKESVTGYRSNVTSALTLLVLEAAPWPPASPLFLEIYSLVISAVVIREIKSIKEI